MATFIQWKGTDLCMDFHCPECEAHSHFDGFFAYHVQCPNCGTFFKMPTDIEVEKLAALPEGECCLYAEPDDNDASSVEVGEASAE